MIPGSAFLIAAIFGVIVATTLGGALLAVLSTRIIRSVTGLALCCVGLAGLYYFLGSPFLALMEILIYVGAVCVTIIFGVMLSEPDEPEPRALRGRELAWGVAASLVSAAVLLGGVRLAGRWTGPVSDFARLSAGGPARADGSVAAIGISLLTTYSLPFELISLVLLVAILGALVIARGGRSRQ
jgi:NADH-quinone oxidoreductase subunit J